VKIKAMKTQINRLFVIVPSAIICLLLLLGGCSWPDENGFAIYLTRADVPPSSMSSLDKIELALRPFIAMNDVIAYNSQTYELKLTTGAFQRFSQLDVPVRGKSFVVCVDREPLYWGAFWTPISSISFDGVTIWKPYSSQKTDVVTLELGYPTPSFYGGKDPRNSPQVIQSFEKAGKLITRLTVAMISQLPNSFKGYELYSWSDGSQWHFTLITGTNRNKNLAEILSTEDFISEAGSIKIQVTGVDELKTLFGKLPSGEYVSWIGGLPHDQPLPAGLTAGLPPVSAIEEIKEYARSLDLVFQ
jgi:hypothetical protein